MFCLIALVHILLNCTCVCLAWFHCEYLTTTTTSSYFNCWPNIVYISLLYCITCIDAFSWLSLNYLFCLTTMTIFLFCNKCLKKNIVNHHLIWSWIVHNDDCVSYCHIHPIFGILVLGHGMGHTMLDDDHYHHPY